MPRQRAEIHGVLEALSTTGFQRASLRMPAAHPLPELQGLTVTRAGTPVAFGEPAASR